MTMQENTASPLFNRWWPRDRATSMEVFLLVLIVAVGAILRFWGLGNLGLHGDEDVMGLASRALRETGWPVLPSGMEYIRALPHTYLLAMSTSLFGDSEWALRLPSVIAGTLGVLVSYWLGRRYLSVRWSLVFAVAIALLPSLISISQTARMYIFYVTLVMLFAVAVFRWERSESFGTYFLALAVCVVSLSFHALTVFSSLLFFYPGLLKSSRRLLVFGGVAFLFCVVFQQVHSEWVGSHYFDLVDRPDEPGDSGSAELARRLSIFSVLVGALAVGASAGCAYVVARWRQRFTAQRLWTVVSVACLVAAVILAYLVQYYLAGIAYLLGTVFFVRAGSRILWPVAIGMLLLSMILSHAYVSWQLPNVEDPLDLVERLAGLGYPKTYLTFAGFAPLAVVLYAAFFSYYLIQFALGKPLPDHALFFLLSVFAPLFLMGFLSSQYVPHRYVIGFLPFFMLTVFAGAFDLFNRYGRNLPSMVPVVHAAALVILVLAFVGFRDLWYNIRPYPEDFPHLTDHRGVDHSGAAQFVRSQNLGPEDLVIAVDTQQQVYYLQERVDYYMRALKDSRNSSFMRDNRMLCLYTGRPQISTGEELAAILSKPEEREILIIGNGELASRNRVRNLGDGLWETMQEFGFEEVYRGRDGVTRVWRYVARGAGPEPTTG